MSKGRSIRLFLADGTPGGIITAEIMNWTGHVMFAPRSRLADLIKRPEATRTGLYFLTSSDTEGGIKPQVYIGETDNVGKRIGQHNKDGTKDFWDRVCFITSKDQNLTKAHVRYLESRLIAIATEAGRATLVNNTAPEYSSLPEADTADMEFFIEQVRVVLPVLGLDWLRETSKQITDSKTPSVDESLQQSPLFELISKKHEIHAEAQEIDGEFIVRTGAIAQNGWVGVKASYKDLQSKLVEAGIMVQEGNHMIFKHDYSFRSPSAAAAVVLGRAANGRTEWILKNSKKTYAEWQDEQVSIATTNTEDD